MSAGFPFRLIATDLDGTLLRSDESISQRTREALAAATAAGAAHIVVTGRAAPGPGTSSTTSATTASPSAPRARRCTTPGRTAC